MSYINKPDPILLGNALHKARKGKGLTQQEVADALCVSNKAVSKWECGRGLPDAKIYGEIERLLDIKIEDCCIPEKEKVIENEGGMSGNINDSEPIVHPERAKQVFENRKKKWMLVLSLGLCLSVGAVSAYMISRTIFPNIGDFSSSSSEESSSSSLPEPAYDISGLGEFIFEAEKAELSENLIIYTDSGSGSGYVGNFDYFNQSYMEWKITSDREYVGQLYFSLVSRGIIDLCKETYTITLNGEEIFSKAVFREPYTSLISFKEYYIAEINLLQGENILKIIFNANSNNNNGHNFDYIKINNRPMVPSADIIIEAEEYQEVQGPQEITHYYDAGSGLGYVGGFDRNDGARLKYCFNVEETETRLMSICLNPRGIKDKISDTYTIILNGEQVESKNVIYGAWKDWIHFEEYFVAMVPLLKGENVLEIIFHANGNEEGKLTENGHNLDYIRFVKYSHYIALGEEKGIFQAEESYYDQRLQVIQDGECTYLGNFDASDKATMQYFVSADREKKVALTMNMIPRIAGEKISDSFAVYVNGKELLSETIIEEEFGGWTNFIEYYIMDIDLEAGVNEILIIYKMTLQNGHNIDWIGLNPVIEKDTKAYTN